MKLFNTIAYHSTKQKGLTQFEDSTSDKNAYKGEGAMVHGWGLYLQADKELNIKRYKDSLGLSSYKGIVSFGDYLFWFDNEHFDKKGACVIFDKNDEPVDDYYIRCLVSHCYNSGGEMGLKKIKRFVEFAKENNEEEDVQGFQRIIDMIGDNKITVKRNEVNPSQYTVDIPNDMVLVPETNNSGLRRYFPQLQEAFIKLELKLHPKIRNIDSLKNKTSEFITWALREAYWGLNDFREHYVNDETITQRIFSETLAECGIDGIKYYGNIDETCYVIFNCSKLKIIGEE